MDTENYRDIAYRALEIYRTITLLQNKLNSLFWNEFLDIEQEEYKKKLEENSISF